MWGCFFFGPSLLHVIKDPARNFPESCGYYFRKRNALTQARISRISKYLGFFFIILANTGISQLSFTGSKRTWATMWCISPCNAHSTQRLYKIKTSLLLRGRDGDTMMSSESSESIAAAPPDSAVHGSFVWSAGDTHGQKLCCISWAPVFIITPENLWLIPAVRTNKEETSSLKPVLGVNLEEGVLEVSQGSSSPPCSSSSLWGDAVPRAARKH